MMTTDGQAMREQVVERYDAVADELERAVAHLRTAAKHYRKQEISRVCAHGWAAHGHIVTAWQQMDDNAFVHAARSKP